MRLKASAVQVAASTLAALCAGPYAVLAQDVATGTLETYVVSPTRVDTPASEVGNSVSKITHDQIEARQILQFDEILRLAPGAVTANTGNRGAISSVFLRGTNSNQTQIVIDGIRINDANLIPNAFLGGAAAHHLDSVEVLRGPQSALYGGEAVGGVISLMTSRAARDHLLTWEGVAGSFGSFETQLAAQVVDGPAAWSLSLGRETTDNARPHNAFEQFFYSGRFDVDLSERARAGFTIRGANRIYESPGSKYQNDSDDVDEDQSILFTTWLEANLTDSWTSRFTYGHVDQELTNRTPPTARTAAYLKDILDWQNTVIWNDTLTTVFGVNREAASVVDNGFGSVSEKETLLAIYGQQSVKLFDALTLTGGTRWQEYDSFGSVWTWRGAGAYHLEESGTIFRASYGTGFRAPSFLELYGTDPAFLPFYPGFQGNPSLRPETSRGWDAGIEQRLFGATSASVTWFANDLRDLIIYDFAALPGTTFNAEEAHTQGLEAEVHGSLQDRLFWQLAYTYLEAENDSTGTRLLRRPEHSLGFDLQTRWLDHRLTLGLGGYAIQNRTDVAASFPWNTIDGDDYFVARAYGSYAVTDNLTVLLRLENAFDEEYDEIDGYPGRPQGLFGGVRLSF